MFGEENQLGIVPRAAEYIFQCLAGHASDVAIRCSFLEIYLDSIRDLGKVYASAIGGGSVSQFMKTSDVFNSIAKKRQDPYLSRAFSKNIQDSNPVLKDLQAEYKSMNLAIHEDIEGNVFVKDLCVVDVTTVEEVMSIITMGLRLRATHETKMNLVSSRSHTVFTIQVIQSDSRGGDATSGMLNLVDLAGSERLKRSESQGQRLKEALHINSSLTCLGKVVMALDPSSDRSHIPYRESKLTRMLQNSLGGNSYTVLLAAIHPNPEYYEECLSTLQFANRCRNVRNNPRVNYVTNADGIEDNARKVKRMQEEITSLRQKLAQQGNRVSMMGGPLGDGSMDKEKEATVFSHRVQQILKKLNMECNVGEHGSLDLEDGRRISSDDVQECFAAGTLAAAKAMGINLSEGMAAFLGALGAAGAGMSSSEAEALKAKNKELMVELRDLKDLMKDRKLKLDEAERNCKIFEVELNRLRALSAHGDYSHKKEINDLEKLYRSQEEILKNKQEQEMRTIVEQNKKLLSQSNTVVQNLPKALRVHTETIKRKEEAKEGYEVSMKAAFQKHLTELDESRVNELEAMKQQYEYWLKQKDDILAEFVTGFNTYRNRKSSHLRSCEKEMATMLAHIERSDNILKNVENGRYFMQHKHNILSAYNEESSAIQDQKLAGSMDSNRTGVTSVIFPRGQVLSSAGNSRPNSGRSGIGEYKRPASATANRGASSSVTNTPVTTNATTVDVSIPVFRSLKDLYPLASRIVLKYKKRNDKEDAAKSEAIDQALYRAKGKTGRTGGDLGAAESTYIPDMDPELQEYVRDLLMSPSKDKMRILGNKVNRVSENQASEYREGCKTSAPVPPKSRPKSASTMSPNRVTAARVTLSSAEKDSSDAAAGLAAAYRGDDDGYIQADDECLGQLTVLLMFFSRISILILTIKSCFGR